MSHHLPASFLEKMKILLRDDYDNFMSSYDRQSYYGVRINELKLSPEQWLTISPLQERVEPIPWTSNAFYYQDSDRPGKHPHYNAGLYYIQEPSAMVPVELLDVKPGHRVLDLCAAPGGKSTQIASKLQGHGVLVTNDIATERTKVLAKNIAMAGVRNAIVLNEEPQKIAERFPTWFDRVLVDAPCSGEGMFRKNEGMIAEWENYSVEKCSLMQKQILDQVAKMVAPGGRIVYSTCTFSPEENEAQIARFIAEHEEFEVLHIDTNWGWQHGNSKWIADHVPPLLNKEKLDSIDGTIRVWPHHTKGEGHFIAVLQHRGEASSIPVHDTGIGRLIWPQNQEKTSKFDRNTVKHKGKKEALLAKQSGKSQIKSSSKELDLAQIWEQFHDQALELLLHEDQQIVVHGDRVYMQPLYVPPLKGLKVVRAGWFIGEIKFDKFHPSQALAMGLTKNESIRVLSLSSDSEEMNRYLKGETIFVNEEQLCIRKGAKKNGFALVCADGYPVGFGKLVDGMLKNELAVGWRRI